MSETRRAIVASVTGIDRRPVSRRRPRRRYAEGVEAQALRDINAS